MSLLPMSPARIAAEARVLAKLRRAAHLLSEVVFLTEHHLALEAAALALKQARSAAIWVEEMLANDYRGREALHQEEAGQ